MAFPLGEVVGAVGIPCLGTHTGVGEVPVVLAVVLRPGVVTEEVLVPLEFGHAEVFVQYIIVVIVLPGDAHVKVQVERIQREQGGIGPLIDELQVIGAMTTLIDVDVLMPDFIG